MKCKDCKHWKQPENSALRLATVQGDDDAPDCYSYPALALGYAERKLGNAVGECRSPKLNRITGHGAYPPEEITDPQRPRFKEASVIDGEDYYAVLLTDEFFGCVNFEQQQ
jgi:hypothetical protein